MRHFTIALLAAALAARAQSPQTDANRSNRFSAPTLGFIAGPTTNQITPILGIPGAARLGDPLLLPNTVTSVHIAPGHAYALIEQGAGGPICVAILRGAALGESIIPLPIAGAIHQADLLAFSPTGSSALLYSQQMNRFQVVTGLPGSPSVSGDFPNASVGGAVSRLAISDDGKALLMADDTGAVSFLAPDSGPVPVYQSPNMSALIFLAKTHDAVVCDDRLNTVVLLGSVTNGPVVKTLTSGSLISQPEAAASSADGKTILVASTSQHLVFSIDPASGAISAHPVANNPSVLDSAGIRDVFLLTRAGDSTHWIFVWQRTTPSTFFVGGSSK
ncbi:MAG: hypothetical protein WB992_04350 [Bryobacteraceae bacterium]